MRASLSSAVAVCLPPPADYACERLRQTTASRTFSLFYHACTSTDKMVTLIIILV